MLFQHIDHAAALQQQDRYRRLGRQRQQDCWFIAEADLMTNTPSATPCTWL